MNIHPAILSTLYDQRRETVVKNFLDEYRLVEENGADQFEVRAVVVYFREEGYVPLSPDERRGGYVSHELVESEFLEWRAIPPGSDLYWRAVAALQPARWEAEVARRAAEVAAAEAEKARRAAAIAAGKRVDVSIVVNDQNEWAIWCITPDGMSRKPDKVRKAGLKKYKEYSWEGIEDEVVLVDLVWHSSHGGFNPLVSPISGIAWWPERGVTENQKRVLIEIFDEYDIPGLEERLSPPAPHEDDQAGGEAPQSASPESLDALRTRFSK